MSRLFMPALALLVSFSLTSQAEELASGERQIEGWGQVVDPDGDGDFQVDGSALTFQMPASVKRLNSEWGEMNAPRVLQPVENDFAIQVTVNGNLSHPDPKAGLRSYVSGGLVLMQDERNYIRLERATFTRSGQLWHYINLERRTAGRPIRMGKFMDYSIQGDEKIQLRLEFREGTLRVLVQRPEEPWHQIAKSDLGEVDSMRAGVVALNTSGFPCEVQFNELTVEADFEPSTANPGAVIDLSAR